MARDPMVREPGGLRLLDLVAVVLRRWRTVLAAMVLTVAAAVAAALLAPPVYVTGTTMVPFSGAQSRTQLLVGQLPAGVANLVGGATGGSDRLIGVLLKSRTLNDSIVSRVARTPVQRAEVHRVLAEGVRTQRNPDGSVVVQVQARDAQLAARIANTYPPLLNDLLARVSADAALRKQGFLQAQLAEARDRLLRSEEQLLAFQRRRSVPNVDEQARRTLEAAATLQEQVMEQERRVAELRRTLAPGNPALQTAIAELETRRGQMRRVTTGGGSPVFVPLGEGGELKAATARLLREFSRDEQVYEALTAALAETQIDANNNLPVLSVLDTAVVPGPTRSLPRTLMLSSILGLLLGLGAAFAGDAAERARRNPGNEAFFRAWSQFKAECARVFLRRTGRRAQPSIAD